MNLRSMTGFGSAQCDLGDALGRADCKGVRLTVDIRSVNSRFLDLSLRLPDEWRPLESGLRDLVQQRLARGKVEVRAACLQAAHDLQTADPARWAVLKSLEDQVVAVFPQAPRLSVAEVLRLSDRPTLEVSLIAPALHSLAQEALEGLSHSREHEGRQLGQALLERLHQLKALATSAQPLVPQWIQAQHERFLQKWQEALALVPSQVSADAARDRALTEATALALRVDISEEITRLQAHLDSIEAVLTGAHQPKGVGKRLDFLVQELHREANTLGSKSSTLVMTQIAVDMKVLIEQMREQVQNLE
ncbi:MAG: hypothetical protein RL111_257 [Pseudomonadota bacterium]